MGSALIHGWIGVDLLQRIDILDPNLDSSTIHDSLPNFQSLFHVKRAAELDFADSDLLILAVKPQIMDVVCESLKDRLPPGLPVLSIAAGKSAGYFRAQFSADTPIIRSMPNTPAAIGEGITALYATGSVTDKQRQIAADLLGAVGQTLWLEDEGLMDAVTAVSGSGPAYVFYMIETMAQAGEAAGLSPEHALKLARQTVIGAAALAAADADTPAGTLRENVTSPGGTTAAALNVLMNGEFQEIMTKAVKAAAARGKELAS